MQILISLPTLIYFLSFYWLVKYLVTSINKWNSGMLEPFNPFYNAEEPAAWTSGYRQGKREAAYELQHITGRLAGIADSLQKDAQKLNDHPLTEKEPKTDDRENP